MARIGKELIEDRLKGFASSRGSCGAEPLGDLVCEQIKKGLLDANGLRRFNERLIDSHVQLVARLLEFSFKSCGDGVHPPSSDTRAPSLKGSPDFTLAQSFAKVGGHASPIVKDVPLPH